MNQYMLSTNVVNSISTFTQTAFEHFSKNSGGYVAGLIAIATTAYCLCRSANANTISDMRNPYRHTLCVQSAKTKDGVNLQKIQFELRCELDRDAFTTPWYADQSWSEGVSILADMARHADREIILAFSSSNRWFNLTSRSEPFQIIEEDAVNKAVFLSEMREVDLPQIGKSITHVHIHPDVGTEDMVSILVNQDESYGRNRQTSKRYHEHCIKLCKLLPSGADVLQYGRLRMRFINDPAFSMKAAIISSTGTTWVDISKIRHINDVDQFAQHRETTLWQMDQDWKDNGRLWSREKLFEEINKGNVKIEFKPHGGGD